MKKTACVARLTMGILLLMMLTVGCTKRFGYTSMNVPGHMKASYVWYTGLQRSAAIQVDEGESIYLAFNSKVEKGSLAVAVVDSRGQEIMNLPTGKRGVKEVKSPAAGQYFLVARAEGSKGFFDIFWEVR